MRPDIFDAEGAAQRHGQGQRGAQDLPAAFPHAAVYQNFIHDIEPSGFIWGTFPPPPREPANKLPTGHADAGGEIDRYAPQTPLPV